MRAAAGTGDGRRVPIRGIRRAIVEQVSRAHREIPAVTFVEECDFTDVDLRCSCRSRSTRPRAPSWSAPS